MATDLRAVSVNSPELEEKYKREAEDIKMSENSIQCQYDFVFQNRLALNGISTNFLFLYVLAQRSIHPELQIDGI